MIKGTTVTVIRPNATTGVDRLNNTIYSEARESVANVLITPGATDDLAASRPEGVSVAYTLHFPKTYTGDLEGCSVELADGIYHVVGKPGRYMDANTPTPWNMPVEVAAAHG